MPANSNRWGVSNQRWLATPEPMTISKAIICKTCAAGILPGDVVFHCGKCKAKPSYCETCWHRGNFCDHALKRVQLEADDDLPVRDKDGDLWLGLKCDKCKAKMKKGEICFKCSRCWDPDLCASCWRREDQRCKHAYKGKVKMCRVGRKDDDEIVEEAIDEIVLALVGG